MRRSLAALIFSSMAGVPFSAHAAVLISEVAWMGSAANANAEWLELSNTGAAPVDLAGWSITSSSGSPAIALAGSITANGFFLLERTSDDSVPGIAADQIYTGSLTNAGATLTLVDGSGAAVDTVVGGTDWTGIGGDNTTKDTVQRTGGGWTTAAPTPRASTAGAAAPAASSTETVFAGSGASASAQPSPSITVAIEAEAKALLEVPHAFGASVRAKGGGADHAARVRWSFGDGSSAEGSTVTKVFRYPGTYIVVATATNGVATARDEFIVSVGAAAVRIADIGNDGITLENGSAARLDLSGWRLSSDDRTFVMPEGVMMVASGRVLFPYAVTGLGPGPAASLFYPNGVLASRFERAPVAPSAPQPSLSDGSSLLVQTGEPAITSEVSVPHYEAQAVSAPREAAEVPISRGAAVAAAAAADIDEPPGGFFSSPWFAGLLAVALIAGGAFVLL